MNKLNTLVEGLRIAWVALNANRIRSSLTILGVAIGVGVVVLMAALITGIRSNVIEGFEAAGPDNLIITRFDLSEVRLVSDGNNRPPWWNTRPITVPEVERVRRLPSVQAAEIRFGFSSSMSFEGTRVSVQSSAASLGWPAHTTGQISAGRNFVPVEIELGRPVVILSKPLAEELFGQRDPIGRRIQVSQTQLDHFQVIGVFDAGDNIFADVSQHFAILPYTAATRRLKASDDFMEVVVVPAAGYSREETQDQVIGTMRAMRGLGPTDDNTFAIIGSDQLVDLFNRFTAVFFVVMLALSSVGLLVGGVGVVGIMMISVTERTREIGIRKALGATKQEILWQFLVEAAFLTLIGGVVGLAGGAALATLVATLTPIPASIPLWSVVAAIAMAVLTGILFGLIPAYRGSRMEPVDALRYE